MVSVEFNQSRPHHVRRCTRLSPFFACNVEKLGKSLGTRLQLADVSTRCSSHPQGKSEARCENAGNLDTRVLDRATRPVQLLVKEALCIQRIPASNRLNRDGGYELPGCWIATMKKLGGGVGTGRTQASNGMCMHTQT